MNASARLTTLTRIGFATRGILYLAIAFLIVRTGRGRSCRCAPERQSARFDACRLTYLPCWGR